MSKAYLDQKGTNFKKLQPNVTIVFTADNVTVTKMYAQVNYSTFPSNVRHICVTLFGANSVRLTYPNKTIIPELVSTRPDTYLHGEYEGVKEIHVRVCGTDQNQLATRFRFSVWGCFNARATYIMQRNTQPTTSPSITTPRKK
jgi:hypothetical protein